MKLYATTTSERASKGQGGNDYIETVYNAVSKDTPSFRVRLINDEQMGLIYFSVEEYFFGQWREKYRTELYINIPPKGEKQKGEVCLTCNSTGWVGMGEKCLNCNPMGVH